MLVAQIRPVFSFLAPRPPGAARRKSHNNFWVTTQAAVASSLIFYLGWLLLAATLGSAVAAAARRKDIHRLDVAAFLVVLVLGRLSPQGAVFGLGVQLALVALLPYVVLRLVRHFRNVPSGLSAAAAIVPAGTLLAPVLSRILQHTSSETWVFAYVCGGLVPLAWTFAREARRSRGVKARRLGSAGAGTLCFAAVFALRAGVRLLDLSPDARLSAGHIGAGFNTLGLLCYFFAFSPPRGITKRWRQAEFANYLSEVNEREPEARGVLAGEDLVKGAERCLGGSLTCVARRQTNSKDLVVVAASDDVLVGVTFTPGDGLVGQAVAKGTSLLGRVPECEPEVARRLTPYGVSVVVSPIEAQATEWGVILVVHRRGALFPEDDRTMLAQLGRYGGTTLDHAALIGARREQERLASEKQLRDLESRVDVMLESITDYAMLALDADGVITAWQTGAQSVFGYTPQQVTRQSAARLFDLTPTVFAEWLREARDLGRAQREGACCRLDHSTFVGATTIRPLRTDPGTPPGFVVVIHDVTERRTLEERMRQGQKMEALGQLAGGVAHDFSNLLTVILGYADWLQQDMIGDARVERIVEIHRTATRAAGLTSQLLAFSRRQRTPLARLDLARLVRDLLPMLRRLLGDAIEIVDATAATSPIMGDRSRVEQILINLVANARDAMQSGGRITIRTMDVSVHRDPTEAGSSGPHVLLEVSDTGVGMDAETRRRAFDPFFTTKDVGRGTGLGLATVHSIVHEMHGYIEIESERHRGTVCRLFLPQAIPDVAPESPVD